MALDVGNGNAAIAALVIKAENPSKAAQYAQDRGFSLVLPIDPLASQYHWIVRVARDDIRAVRWMTEPPCIMPAGGYAYGTLLWFG